MGNNTTLLARLPESFNSKHPMLLIEGLIGYRAEESALKDQKKTTEEEKKVEEKLVRSEALASDRELNENSTVDQSSKNQDKNSEGNIYTSSSFENPDNITQDNDRSYRQVEEKLQSKAEKEIERRALEATDTSQAKQQSDTTHLENLEVAHVSSF